MLYLDKLCYCVKDFQQYFFKVKVKVKAIVFDVNMTDTIVWFCFDCSILSLKLVFFHNIVLKKSIQVGYDRKENQSGVNVFLTILSCTLNPIVVLIINIRQCICVLLALLFIVFVYCI